MINMFKKEFKRELWLMYVNLFFLLFINVMYRFILQNGYESTKWYNDIYSSFSTLIVLTGISAIVIAIFNFKYLHNSYQLDLEHSLPVTRKDMFLIKYIRGVLYFAIPYFTVFIVLCLMDNMFYPSTEILSIELILFSLKYVFIITFVYTVIVFANLISGTSYYSVLIGLILLFFMPVFSSFQFGSRDALLLKYYNFNDMINYYLIGDLTKNYYSITSYLITIILFAFAILLLNLLCIEIYKRRKSEYNEMPIAFPKSRIILSIIVVYSFSSLISISFLELDRSPVFGFIISCIIVLILSFVNNVFVNRGIQKFKLKKYALTALSSGVLMFFTFGILSSSVYDDILTMEIKAKGIDYANFSINNGNYLNEQIVLPTPVDFDLCIELIEELDKQSKSDEYNELNKENSTATQVERNNFIRISSNIFASEKGFLGTKIWYLDNTNSEDIDLLNKIMNQNTEQSVYSTLLNTFENITSVEIKFTDAKNSVYTEFNEGIRKYPYFSYRSWPIGDEVFRQAFIKDLAQITQTKGTKQSVYFDDIPLFLANCNFSDYGDAWYWGDLDTNLPITKEWKNTLAMLEVPNNNYRIYDISKNTKILNLILQSTGIYDYSYQIGARETFANDVFKCVSGEDFKEYTTEDIINEVVNIQVYTPRITSSVILEQDLKLIIDNSNNLVYFGIVE